MRLGYSISSSFPSDQSPDAAARSVLEAARTARNHGIDYVQVGDHHDMAGDPDRSAGYLQNVPTVGRLTEMFDHVSPLFLLPLYHPVLVAEYLGTLGAFADVEPWFALGWRRAAYDTFDMPWTARSQVFEEKLELVSRLGTETDVTFHGDYHRVEAVTVTPRVDPERIVIGGSAEPAVRRAGRLGDAWAAGPSESRPAIERKREWIEDAGGGDLIVRRDALVLADGDTARDRARSLLESGYRGWPVDAEWLLVGDAGDVAAELAELRDLGATDVVVRPMDSKAAADTFAGLARARELL